MQLLATAEQMRSFDEAAIGPLKIPGLILMENAGRAFVDELIGRVGNLQGKRAVVVCGKGNNGGDGLVIARHLANRGCEVRVVLLARKSDLSGDARSNLESALGISRLPHSRLRVREVRSARALSATGASDVIVDAIFGTGFTGEVRGIAKDAIGWINAQDGIVASVDIPSGVDASTGIVGNVAVKARLTVTMGLAKIGHYVGAGCDQSGEVRVADISIPPVILRAGRDQTYRVGVADVRASLPHRARTVHKYSAGKVLVLAGSKAFTGAPVMTALSALRSGAGAVVVAFPASIHTIVARRLTEVLMAPVAETATGSLGAASLGAIREKARWADCVAVGPGLSRDEETLAMVRELLSELECPVVVDADALFALSGHTSIVRRRKADTILTPHTGEFSALTGVPSQEAELQRVSASRTAARRLGAVVVLKGAPTATADKQGGVYLNSTGNPGMATIGSGDVLTGLIAGLLAQGMSSSAAAWAGVYLHGLAGDIAAARLGQRSVLASDIENSIPAAFQSLH